MGTAKRAKSKVDAAAGAESSSAPSSVGRSRWPLFAGAMAALVFGLAGAASVLAFRAQDPATGAAPAPVMGYRVVATYPHSTDAFCQGLEIENGKLFEGTGLYGQSTLREVDLTSGKVNRLQKLAPNLFGEGITVWNGKVYQLTWQNRQGLVYDAARFRLLQHFRYTGEGWGLTNDGKHLILSDGTSTLRFLDPRTFKLVRRVTVTDAGRPIDQLNELEYINGEVYANVWNTDYIVKIDPASGRVTAWLDLAGLMPNAAQYGSNAVLNGIAYDEKTKKLYVTGKNWPRLFEIEIVPKA